MHRLCTRVVIGSLILHGLWPPLVWSHAFPHHSEPKVGAVMATVPSQVRIWFDAALEPVFSHLRVEDANGRQVDRGDGRVDSADTMLLEAGLTPLPPGTYRVIWNVVARDGHRTEGDFTFTVSRERST